MEQCTKKSLEIMFLDIEVKIAIGHCKKEEEDIILELCFMTFFPVDLHWPYPIVRECQRWAPGRGRGRGKKVSRPGRERAALLSFPRELIPDFGMLLSFCIYRCLHF